MKSPLFGWQFVILLLSSTRTSIEATIVDVRRPRILLMLLLAISFGVNDALSSTKPNIIVIYSDDHGYADLGIQGVVRDLKTPHLDALGKSGVVALHGYSTAPQCVPSRGGLMTGKFQGRFDLDNNGSSLNGFNREVTIAERLRRVGYATAQFGKWHLGPTEEIPKHGFLHTFSQNAQRPFHANITLDGKDRPMGVLEPDRYHIEACSLAAASMIERYRDQPFFLYVAYRAPHTPLDAPEKYTSRFPGPMPERRRQALAMISAIDDGVGLLKDTLQKHRLTERTLLFFIGDNGAPLKIHKVDSPLQGDAGGWDGSLNEPLNGEKGMLSEGGIRVPFLISWPGTIPDHQKLEHPVSALDVAATAAAVAEIDAQEGEFDGVNLVPYLRGEISTPPHRWLTWRWGAQSAIREGNWKLLRGGDREYLYDLGDDPGEKRNLVTKDPLRAEQLRTKLLVWSQELVPPGLNIAPMSKVWTEYFDVYLDGKPSNPPKESVSQEKSSTLQGWTARNGILVEKEGFLEFTSSSKGKAPGFIAQSKLNLLPRSKIRLEFMPASKGQILFSWRTVDEPEFIPSKRFSVDIAAPSQWKELLVQLPETDRIIHLRIQFPEGVTRIRKIDWDRSTNEVSRSLTSPK